jgi:hypothetical protein
MDPRAKVKPEFVYKYVPKPMLAPEDTTNLTGIIL